MVYIKKIKLTNKIYILEFKTSYNLSSTFLRFQEYYESPKFKGKIFSLKEFKKWYVINSPKGRKTGRFTYYWDWTGFNIPSEALMSFYEGKFDPLSEKEKQLLKLFKNVKTRFYVIGVFGKKYKNILKHEIAHALFYTSPKYRKKVLKIVSEFNLKKIKKKLLSTKGYNEGILNDEIQAYALSPSKKLKLDFPSDLINKLERIFIKFVPKF